MCVVQVQAVCDWLGRSLATYSQWPGLGSLATTLLSSLTVLRWELCWQCSDCDVPLQDGLHPPGDDVQRAARLQDQ